MENISKLNFTPAVDLLYGAERIVITAHIDPDGDAIGSALALYEAATNIGKEAHIIINESDCPERYTFLQNSKQVKMYDMDKHSQLINSADAIFILDVGELNRTKLMGDAIKNSPAKKILIDHHKEPENFTDVMLSDPDASSTGELMYYLIKQANIKITKDIAEALYTAIWTDSGGLQYPRTTAQLHYIIAELIESGAEPTYMYDNIYNNKSLDRLRLEALAIDTIELYHNGLVAIMYINEEMLQKTNTTNRDTEEFSQILLSIRGVKVAIFIRELSDNDELETRVSLRSKGNINVQRIALKYGGGGHLHAAGCRLHNTPFTVAKQLILNEIII